MSEESEGGNSNASNNDVMPIAAPHNRAVPDPDSREQESKQPYERGHAEWRHVSRRENTSELNEAGLIHTGWVVEGRRHEVLQAGQSDRRGAQQENARHQQRPLHASGHHVAQVSALS